MNNNKKADPNPHKPRRQARGLARREDMLNAAVELYTDQAIDDVSFKDIYERAGLLPGSAYRFFANLDAIYQALQGRYIHEMEEVLATPFNPGEINSWQSLSDKMIETVAGYFNNSPAAARILAGVKLPIGLMSREDRVIGDKTAEVYAQHFILPRIPNRQDVFLICGRLITQVFALSLFAHGRITDGLLEEAKVVGRSYLGTYMPEKLLRRGIASEQEERPMEDGQLFPAHLFKEE